MASAFSNQRIEKLFISFDKDNDNYLSYDDLVKPLCRLYFGMGEEFLALEKRRLIKAVEKAEKAKTAASLKRADLPASSSRARITSANARFSTAAEHLWRMESHLRYVTTEAGNKDEGGAA